MRYKQINKYLIIFIFIYIPLSLIYPILAYQFRDNNRLIVMTPDNTYFITEYSTEKEQKIFYEDFAIDAANAFLQRNPKGLDNPVMFNDIYIDQAHTKAMQNISESIKEFMNEQMHQKVEVTNISVISNEVNHSFIKLSGQLIRSYKTDGRYLTYTVQFDMLLTIELNTNIATNSRYPYIVQDFKYKEQHIK